MTSLSLDTAEQQMKICRVLHDNTLDDAMPRFLIALGLLFALLPPGGWREGGSCTFGACGPEVRHAFVESGPLARVSGPSVSDGRLPPSRSEGHAPPWSDRLLLDRGSPISVASTDIRSGSPDVLRCRPMAERLPYHAMAPPTSDQEVRST